MDLLSLPLGNLDGFLDAGSKEDAGGSTSLTLVSTILLLANLNDLLKGLFPDVALKEDTDFVASLKLVSIISPPVGLVVDRLLCSAVLLEVSFLSPNSLYQFQV